MKNDLPKSESKVKKNVVKKINPQVNHLTGTWENGPAYDSPDTHIPITVREQISIGEAMIRYSPLSPEEEEYRRNTHPRHWYVSHPDAPCGLGYIQAVQRYQKRQEEIFFKKAGKITLCIVAGAATAGFLRWVLRKV